MEVLLAIAIVAIIAGPLLQTFVTSTAVGRRSYDTDKANTVSVKTVEEIKGTPSSIDTSRYSYNEVYDSSLGKYVHTYTRTQYYDRDWNGPYDTDLGGTCPFRQVITARGEEDAASDLDGLSYIPELVAASGARTGQNYRLEVDYGSMTSNSYLITVTKDGTQYTVSTSEGILKSTLTGVSGFSQSIPLEDCISGVIPIVVDVGDSPMNYVTFTVDNRTGKELGLYIYGDYYNDPHYITATLTSGVMTVNYMKVSSATLSYDKLDLNVKVYRQSDGVKITDYTTLLYLSQ